MQVRVAAQRGGAVHCAMRTANRGAVARFHGYRATQAQRPRPSDRFGTVQLAGPCGLFGMERSATGEPQ